MLAMFLYSGYGRSEEPGRTYNDEEGGCVLGGYRPTRFGQRSCEGMTHLRETVSGKRI
jgi:hypothetical protein